MNNIGEISEEEDKKSEYRGGERSSAYRKSRPASRLSFTSFRVEPFLIHRLLDIRAYQRAYHV